MARPVDPRLWRHARSARRYLIVSVALSLVITAAIVVGALALARIAAGVITDPGRRTLAAWTAELVVLVVAIAARVVATWWQSRLAHRAGARVVSELETSVLAAGAALPPRESDSRRTELAVVVGDGLGGLRAYLTGYLPALLLAALVPPIVLAVIAAHDLTAAIIILVTLPLIPIFMILIGLMTQGRADAALTATTRLSDQMLDLFAGMPTLRALGRESGAADDDAPTMRHRVRELGEALRVRTMATLRMAFLSSMVLEMLATLCVALVAVSIGMRLVFGHMGLHAGLLGLILAPEVYLPLRAVGERFHAAQDGMAAAERAFAVLDPKDSDTRADRRCPAAESSARRSLPASSGPIELCDVGVRSRDGYAPAELSAVIRPGEVTVLTGPNGSGKSTALQVVLGLTAPEHGRVLVAGHPVGDLAPDDWWARIAWLPQRPVLLPGTLRENLELFGARSDARDIDRACAATGFDAVLAELPDGWDTVVGSGGLGLSLGQRQRLALVRVLAADRTVLLLDEPTAHLDDHSEATVLAALAERARCGATVVVVAHRPTVLAIADHLVEVQAERRAVNDADVASDPVAVAPAASLSTTARPVSAYARVGSGRGPSDADRHGPGEGGQS
ncbi:thiol reductant ABC exporter subunit CydD [Nocardia sp. NPDC052254]|uniref:thiol reductant ABC exporter subunit CydD n=1 Tax=Nocardia sp. NPDC052254 TaxID=3155681 RepID=UPI003449922B